MTQNLQLIRDSFQKLYNIVETLLALNNNTRIKDELEIYKHTIGDMLLLTDKTMEQMGWKSDNPKVDGTYLTWAQLHGLKYPQFKIVDFKSGNWQFQGANWIVSYWMELPNEPRS